MARWSSIAALVLLVACDGGGVGSSPTVSDTPVETVASSTTSEPASESNSSTSVTTTSTTTTTQPSPGRVIGYEVYDVPSGSRPHDVAPAGDGTVWYTAQGTGRLGRLDPATGSVEEVPLGAGSAPHGVIVGPEGDAWVTDGGLDAIVRVDGETLSVEVFPIGRSRARLNTAAFDGDGVLWFTGQAGIYGRFDPATSEMETFDAPGGSGPYGITSSPSGEIFYASLAGSHIARIDTATGVAERIDPPTAGQGARRVWSDSAGNIWVAEWNAGQVGRYTDGAWTEWVLPGESPQAYAVYVDETDTVWLSDFGGDHALVRFDPRTESFDRFPLPTPGGGVRQLLGVPGEVWGAQSAADSLIVLRYEN